MVIWKWSFPVDKLLDVMTFKAPAKTRLLSVGNQDEQLCVWGVVDPKAPAASKMIRVIGTGNSSGLEAGDRFLGTVPFMGGKFIVHVFEM